MKYIIYTVLFLPHIQVFNVVIDIQASYLIQDLELFIEYFFLEQF